MLWDGILVKNLRYTTQDINFYFLQRSQTQSGNPDLPPSSIIYPPNPETVGFISYIYGFSRPVAHLSLFVSFNDKDTKLFPNNLATSLWHAQKDTIPLDSSVFLLVKLKKGNFQQVIYTKALCSIFQSPFTNLILKVRQLYLSRVSTLGGSSIMTQEITINSVDNSRVNYRRNIAKPKDKIIRRLFLWENFPNVISISVVCT